MNGIERDKEYIRNLKLAHANALAWIAASVFYTKRGTLVRIATKRTNTRRKS